MYVQHQGPTKLQTVEGQGFFELAEERVLKQKSCSENVKDTAEESLFECSVPGCYKAFKYFSEMEMHLDIGQHSKKDSVYDKIRRYWAAKFDSVDVQDQNVCASRRQAMHETQDHSGTHLEMGWALNNQRTNYTRFSAKVKDYLTAKFMLGEQSGLKADPVQVEKEMKNARNPTNERRLRSRAFSLDLQLHYIRTTVTKQEYH